MTVQGSTSSGQPRVQAIQLQVERTLASSQFVRSARMCRFLRFVVARALAKDTASLKEYSIGVEVFDRPESFDPTMDPIVRVEARRLRTKLCKYYESEGRHDEIVIELPKGGYMPKFRTRDASAEAPKAVAGGRGIAVLPFQTLSLGEEVAYFGDGLTWELIHHLTRIPDLRVVAWNSASQIRGEQQDLAAVREKLKVDSILTGSVRLAQEKLRVVLQIIDTATGSYLWSETFDGSTSDIFSIQERIAEAIVRKLSPQPGRAASGHITRYCPDAYRTYLRARFEANQRTEAALRQSLEDFREAVRLDPEFALAYAGMADACSLLADYGHEPPEQIVPQARAAALRALELDATLAEAHCSLGYISVCEWKWDESEVHYLRALDLNPGYATAHHWYAVDYLVYLARFEEAHEELEIARQLDPLSPIICEGQCMTYMLQGNYDEAVSRYRRLLQAEPSFYKARTGLGRALVQLGRYADALEQLEMARQLVGDIPSLLGLMGQAYALLGRTGKARELLACLSELARTRRVFASCYAMIHLGLGESAQALDRLEEGAAKRDLPLAALKVHPAYDTLRADPRFTALLVRVGLQK